MNKMLSELTQNAVNILGASGAKWIADLPDVIEQLSKQWQLKNIIPVDNMSYHYVAKAMRDDNMPVVLKIGFDKKSMINEMQALSYFNGHYAWIVIDPKGIVGEPEFEVAAFYFIHPSEMKNGSHIKKIFDERLHLIAEKSQLNAERIKCWVFVRLMLSAAWHIEDNGDPGWAIVLAKRIMM